MTALMFRDQLFEEDESEYLPKKKAEEDEEEEEGLDEDGEQGTSLLCRLFHKRRNSNPLLKCESLF